MENAMVSHNSDSDLITKIVQIELEMFKSVNSSTHSPCQDNLKTFQPMRWMHYSTLPEYFLESYLDDLQTAQSADRNFMTEKYARMENKIPPLSTSPLIENIVNTEISWMRDVATLFPKIFRGNGEGFQRYISCELEVLSDRSLELLWKAVSKARTEGRNLVRERYENLFRKLGYASLAEREASIPA